MKINIFTPGRTELAGNHTDHQMGRILASGVDLGLYAVCEPNDESIIRIHSEGYEPMEIKLSQMEVNPSEFGSSRALVRGVAAAFDELGLKIGGFNANVRSTLSAGSGLSSSSLLTYISLLL